jgi:hypothetical protein
MDAGPEYWFPAKRHGWGWGPPRCWQGWGVLLAWIAAVTATADHVADDAGDVVLAVLGWTGVPLLVCWWKGEPPGGLPRGHS